MSTCGPASRGLGVPKCYSPSMAGCSQARGSILHFWVRNVLHHLGVHQGRSSNVDAALRVVGHQNISGRKQRFRVVHSDTDVLDGFFTVKFLPQTGECKIVTDGKHL